METMQALNLPPADLKIVRRDGRLTVFDPLRRRYVTLTPEERVRQHFVRFLQTHKGFPPEVIANEVSLSLNGTQKRCDTVVYGPHAEPLMIVEYKAGWLVVSNGRQHFCCHIDYTTCQYHFLPDIPSYDEMLQGT